MIIVLTGTLKRPFPRLVSAVAEVTRMTPHIPVVFQTGQLRITNPLPSWHQYSYLDHQVILSLLASANHIICAAGEGIMADMLQLRSVRPLLFPRLIAYDEHVDDQQIKLALELQRRNMGLVGISKKDIRAYLSDNQPFLKKSPANNELLISKLTAWTNELTAY